MLADSELLKTFSVEALVTAIYLQNRSPTKPVEGKTPYEVVYGEKPNVGHLKVFGYSAYSYVPKDERQNWIPKLVSVSSWDILVIGRGTDCIIKAFAESSIVDTLYSTSLCVELRRSP